MATSAESSVRTDIDNMAHAPATPERPVEPGHSVATAPPGTTQLPGNAAVVHRTIARPDTNDAPGANGNGTNGGNGDAAAPAAPPRPWTTQDSARLYGIRNWG